jgi:hypothetical protein
MHLHVQANSSFVHLISSGHQSSSRPPTCIHTHAIVSTQALSLLHVSEHTHTTQDAHNLAWKLASVLHKLAPASLLETYTHERKSVQAQARPVNGICLCISPHAPKQSCRFFALLFMCASLRSRRNMKQPWKLPGVLNPQFPVAFLSFRL